MSNVSMRKMRKTVDDFITAQVQWNAEREARDAEMAVLDKKFKLEYERRMKRLDEDMGSLGRSYGDLVESMFANLADKFNALGYRFTTETKGAKFRDENNEVVAEVDRYLANGDCVLLVEVKAQLKIGSINYHIKQLGVISKLLAKGGDTYKVIGAVAGGTVPENVLKYALRKGLYVLVLNGENVELAELPENFKPREW